MKFMHILTTIFHSSEPSMVFLLFSETRHTTKETYSDINMIKHKKKFLNLFVNEDGQLFVEIFLIPLFLMFVESKL